MSASPIRMRFPLLLFCCILGAASLLTSCSNVSKRLERAKNLEQQEQWNAALLAYNRFLPTVPNQKKPLLADIYTRVAHCLIELDLGNQALSALEKAESLDPDSPAMHLRMGQLLVMAGMPEQAAPHLAFVATSRPSDPELLEVRGSMYAAQENAEAAERDLLRAYETGSHRDRIAERLANLYVDQERPDKARAILTSAAARAPHKSHLLLALARLEETIGNNAAAEQDYRQAVSAENNVENSERLAQFLARNAQIYEAETVLRNIDQMHRDAPVHAADLEFETGRPQQALHEYEAAYGRLLSDEVLKDSADSKPASRRIVAARMIEADLAQTADAPESTVKIARFHLALVRTDLDPVMRELLSAEIEFAARNLPDAEQHVRRALILNAKSAEAHYLIGVIAGRRGQITDAEKSWAESLQCDSSYVPARMALAAESLNNKDGLKAEDYVIDVVRDEPANLDALLMYARALTLQQRFDSARIMCQRAITAAPTDGRAPELLGEIELREGHLASALLEFEKSMMLDPRSADAIEGLTSVYQAGGATQPLLHKLERLARSGPPSSRMMEIAGRLYASKGRYKDAERCLRSAVRMDPHRASAAFALAETYMHQNARANTNDPAAQVTASEWTNLVSSENRSLIAALDADNRRDSSASVRDYEAAVRSGDPTGIASNNLAWIYAMQSRNLDRALQLAQHALQLNPGNPAVLDTIGVIHVRKHEYSQAISSFKIGARRARELQDQQELRRTIEQHLAYASQLAGQPPAQEQASN